MKKKHKKMIVAVAMGLLASVGLVACGNNSKVSNSKNNENLTVWTTQNTPATSAKTWRESPWHMGYAKATGIEVNWEFPTKGNTGEQAFNLLTAQKDLPDIIGYDFMNKADQYIKDGIIRSWTATELKEKAPNYWKYLSEHPEFDLAMKTDQGEYYMFGYNKTEEWQTTWQGPLINQTYLNELGLKAPTNIQEWDAYLVAANEKYGAKFGMIQVGNPGFAGAFGAMGSSPLSFYIEEGQVKVPQMDPAWKDNIAWLASLYERGLLDKDFETMDNSALTTKVAQGKISGAIEASASAGFWTKASQENKKNQVWEAVGYPKQANGQDSTAIYGGITYAASGYAISTSCPENKVDEAFKWLDYAFSEEGMAYWNYGIKGESYTIEDGKVVFTDKVTNNPAGVSEGRFLYTMSHMGMGVQLTDTVYTKEDKDGSMIWYNSAKEAVKSAMPTVTLTNSESKEAASIQNTISTYVSEQTLKYITGKESLDTYDTFVKTMKKQGLDKLLEIEQGAYDRFEKR